MVNVELVYVLQDKSVVHKTLNLKAEATVEEALIASGIYNSHPETRAMAVGIYAKKVSLSHRVKDGDRIEIYRPLILDPKEKRRQKAHSAKKKKNNSI